MTTCSTATKTAKNSTSTKHEKLLKATMQLFESRMEFETFNDKNSENYFGENVVFLGQIEEELEADLFVSEMLYELLSYYGPHIIDICKKMTKESNHKKLLELIDYCTECGPLLRTVVVSSTAAELR